MRSLSKPFRILGLDPTTSGFAWVVWEKGRGLLDWKSTGPPRPEASALIRRFRTIVDRYKPRVLVIEDSSGDDSPRTERARDLLADLAAIATERGIEVREISRADLEGVFGPKTTKEQRVTFLIDRFPGLEERRPRDRSRGDRRGVRSEDPRTNVFDAAALVVTHLRTLPDLPRPSTP